MSVSYTVGKERATLVFAGEVSYAEASGALRRLFADPAYPAGLPLLIDTRPSAPAWSWARQSYWDLVELLGTLAGGRRLRIAMVVDTQRGFGTGRMLEQIGTSHGLVPRVFQDADEAERWLARG